MFRRLVGLYDSFLLKAFDVSGDILLLILRLYFGYQFLISGWGKLHSIERVTGFFTSLGIPAPALNAWFVSGLECVGGLLLILGLGARLISSLLAVNMMVAYLTADRDALTGIFQDPEPFLKADPFLFLLTSLIVMAFGPGRVSVDFLIGRWLRRRQPAAGLPSVQSPSAG